jgi:hypothetical protein
MAKPRGGLTEWFKQDWVDIGSRKKGGGFAKCGRSKLEKDRKRKYPKCVPAAKAARMSDSEIKSAVRRKRAKKQGVGGKPTNVKTFARDGGAIMPGHTGGPKRMRKGNFQKITDLPPKARKEIMDAIRKETGAQVTQKELASIVKRIIAGVPATGAKAIKKTAKKLASKTKKGAAAAAPASAGTKAKKLPPMMKNKGGTVKKKGPGMNKGGTVKKKGPGMNKGGTVKKKGPGMNKGGTIKKVAPGMRKGGSVKKPSTKNSGLFGRR